MHIIWLVRQLAYANFRWKQLAWYLTYIKIMLMMGMTEKKAVCLRARELCVPPLTDPDRLAAYIDALRNWDTSDYIQFELTEEAYRWIRRELGDITLKEVGRLMFEHVNAGGKINEVRETRTEWSDKWEFHHDVQLTIRDKPVYIETRLHYRLPVKPDELWILVVNVH